jgi:hypothetical protein
MTLNPGSAPARLRPSSTSQKSGSNEPFTCFAVIYVRADAMTDKKTDKDDRKELERRMEHARRMAAGADPLTKERLEKLIRDIEEQLR